MTLREYIKQRCAKSDEDYKYYLKLPPNRQKELRRMLRLKLQMIQNGGTASELKRLTKYSKVVVRPAYRYYMRTKQEYGIYILEDKYYVNNKLKIDAYDISDWVHELTKEVF